MNTPPLQLGGQGSLGTSRRSVVSDYPTHPVSPRMSTTDFEMNDVSAKMPLTDTSPANKREPSAKGGAQPSTTIGASIGSYLRRIVSVRTIAAAMCFLLIVATAATVIVVTSIFSLDAAREIASSHALAISSKVKSDVEAYLEVPLRSVRGWQFTVGGMNVKLPTEDPDAQADWTERLAAPMGANNFIFDYSVIGFDDGSYSGCQKYGSYRMSCNTIEWGDRDVNNASTYSISTTRIYLQSNFSYLGGWRSGSYYDSRTRSWYHSVNHTPNAIQWTPVYLSSYRPIIDVNGAIFNSSGSLMGVAGLTLGLGALETVLSSLDTTDNTVSLLLDNDGMLLATSYSEPFLTRVLVVTANTTVESNCLATRYNSTHSVLVCRGTPSLYKYAPLNQLAIDAPELVANGVANTTSVHTLDGQRYYVAVVPIETPLAGGMGWRFALFLPEDDIIGGIVKGRNLAIYICIGVVGLAVIIALVVITLLLRPLDAVADRMYRVAMMQDVDDSDEDDDDEPTSSTKRAEPSKSVLYEIATIQTAFNTMTAELAKIKSFLPQSVLAQLYGDDEDEEGSEVASNVNETLSASRMSAVSRGASTAVSGPSHQVSGGRRGTTRSESSSHGSSANGHHGLNTTVKLATRNVTMLCLNVLGYHKHVHRRSTADTMRQHGLIVKAVSDVCSEHRGVMDGFQGDRFTISFNAVTNAGGHAVLAARTARAISDAVSSRTPLTVSAGIASGSAMVGNMGSATTKRFTVLSHAVSSAVLLERLSKRYSSMLGDEPVTLVGGSAQDDIDHVFDTLVVDAVMLPTMGGGTKRACVCAVMGAKKSAADEWMYEMQEATKNSKYGATNAAFAMLLDGMVCEAEAAVSEERNKIETMHSTGSGEVLRFIDELISRAHSQNDATEFGRTYANDLADYYAKCVLPHIPSSSMNEVRKLSSVTNSSISK